jgi:hypothetical protein
MDEFRHHTPGAKAGVLLLRSLSDDDVLAVARDGTSPQYAAVLAEMGPATNRSWITAQAAEVAYFRGLMDEIEFDYICR